jgi:hypothetical protein
MKVHPIPSWSKYCFRSPGATAPALAFSQSLWALMGREDPIELSLEQACTEEFTYLEVGLREDQLAIAEGPLKRFPLKLIAQGWATTLSDAVRFLDRAAQLGAVALNLHLGHAYMPVDEAACLIGEVQCQAESFNLPLLLETHRGRLTQDLFRTAAVLEQLPEALITLDVSHYIVAGEGLGGSAELFQKHMFPLLTRTALIHGRISNGQSVQVSIHNPFASTSTIESLWRRAMRIWLADAPADAVFVFEPELGPPPYAYLDMNEAETFSRSTETMKLIGLARAAWNAAKNRADGHNSSAE